MEALKLIEINIRETLKEEGGEFLGWTGEVRGKNKIFLMRCKEGHVTEKACGNFKQGKRCRVCADINLSLLKTPDLSFYKNKLNSHSNYKVTMHITKLLPNRKVNLFCEVCAEDIFSLYGLGCGNFPIARFSLNNGCIPCRCNPSKQLTEEQTTFLLKRSLEDIGKVFIGWVGIYKGNKTYFRLKCSKGTVHKMNYATFKINSYKCKCCGERKEGFDYNSEAVLYMFKVERKGKIGCKVGITNCADLRYSGHNPASDSS